MISVLAAGRWVMLLALTVNGLVQAAAAIGAALAVERAFAALAAPTRSPREIALVAAGLLVAAVVSAGLRARERVDGERLGQHYTHDLRMSLFTHLTAMSPRAVASRSQGATALRFIGDLTAVRKWISLGLSRMCVAGTMTVATITALALVDRALALATGLAALVGAAGAVREGPALRDATQQARRRRARLAGGVTEAIVAVGVVQANNAVGRERRRVRKHSRRLRNAMVVRARRLGRLQAVAEGTGAGATAALLLTGLVVGIGAPQVAAGMTVVGLLVPQLRGLARVQEYRQGHVVAVAAITRFLDRPPQLSEPAEPTDLAPGPGALALRGASLGPVLDVTVAVPAGQTVAVVGPNGAGKSTLFAMIGRLVDLDTGSVSLDGTDLATVPLTQTHGAVGMAGPDLPLMKGSLRRNLTYRHRDASTEELLAVLRRCDLVGLLATLPDGLDTRIAEGGSNLSSGQRQRILLARAVLGQPRLLLLDEADANLDAATMTVLDAVLAAHEGTALVITHRRDRVARADVVWHLADGRLVESGSPRELLSGTGPTARLFATEEVSA